MQLRESGESFCSYFVLVKSLKDLQVPSHILQYLNDIVNTRKDLRYLVLKNDIVRLL